MDIVFLLVVFPSAVGSEMEHKAQGRSVEFQALYSTGLLSVGMNRLIVAEVEVDLTQTQNVYRSMEVNCPIIHSVPVVLLLYSLWEMIFCLWVCKIPGHPLLHKSFSAGRHCSLNTIFLFHSTSQLHRKFLFKMPGTTEEIIFVAIILQECWWLCWAWADEKTYISFLFLKKKRLIDSAFFIFLTFYYCCKFLLFHIM